MSKTEHPALMRDDGRPVGRPFRKGEGGRPKGARNKLGEEFLEALFADFQAHGAQTIERVRTEKPDAYLKVIASILPRNLNVAINETADLSDDELRMRIRDLECTLRPFLSQSSNRGRMQ